MCILSSIKHTFGYQWLEYIRRGVTPHLPTIHVIHDINIALICLCCTPHQLQFLYPPNVGYGHLRQDVLRNIERVVLVLSFESIVFMNVKFDRQKNPEKCCKVVLNFGP